MRTRFACVAASLFLVAGLVLAGCTGGSPGAGGAPGAGSDPALPSGFAGDTAKAVKLVGTAKGAGVSVPAAGGAVAAVYAPPGAADTAEWIVTPLIVSPLTGVAGFKSVCPGVYVETKGADPKRSCSIGFKINGYAPAKNLTIVKYADDGKSFEVVPTSVSTTTAGTLLMASVDGFSAYGAGEADQQFIDRANAKGQQVDWTIKVSGSETQDLQGWKMTYDVDLFASGGSTYMGGVYKGYMTMAVKGKYDYPSSIVKGLGKISYAGRDDALTFVVVDDPVVDLLTGEPVKDEGGETIVSSLGKASLKGLASLDITARAANASGKYSKQAAEGTPQSFQMTIRGEDVQLEIPNVGIFPGKILRTTK
ncbi:MAG: hypothetical protein Q7W30_00425 [Coriobacteriia bacterium]|nr:hypothetical protein [Coriobacteriia bacterium]